METWPAIYGGQILWQSWLEALFSGRGIMASSLVLVWPKSSLVSLWRTYYVIATWASPKLAKGWESFYSRTVQWNRVYVVILYTSYSRVSTKRYDAPAAWLLVTELRYRLTLFFFLNFFFDFFLVFFSLMLESILRYFLALILNIGVLHHTIFVYYFLQ